MLYLNRNPPSEHDSASQNEGPNVMTYYVIPISLPALNYLKTSATADGLGIADLSAHSLISDTIVFSLNIKIDGNGNNYDMHKSQIASLWCRIPWETEIARLLVSFLCGLRMTAWLYYQTSYDRSILRDANRRA